MEWRLLPKWITPEHIVCTWKDSPGIAFLDSSDNVNPRGRYSFVGCEPFLRCIYHDSVVVLEWKNGLREVCADPWQTLRNLLNTYRIQDPFSRDLPAGAAIGYLSYDLGMEIEGVKSNAHGVSGWPLFELHFYDLLFCFSRQGGENCVVSTGFPLLEPGKRRRHARNRLNEVFGRLNGTSWDNGLEEPGACVRDGLFECTLESNFDCPTYCASIRRIKEYIAAGDVYQVNLSQSFSGEIEAGGWSTYRYIRQRNRVPFGAYLRSGTREILCFSMERFLRMQGNMIETRPIKGTRPRGRTQEEDLRLSRELRASGKDQAELVMIVDMERNDLGKVCKPGTVRVKRLFEVEQYATVFHLVSTITGTLAEGADQIDCMKACLPGGSITGAPKIRAMEIIDELEGIKREVYCGAIGYFGFNGVSDFNIPIRTIQKEGKRIRFNAGGGVLYDSDPEDEYRETLHKVRSFIECLSSAQCPGPWENAISWKEYGDMHVDTGEWKNM
ncbi:MAG: aminodeoxychorismate synthase component I [bacterium]